MTYVKLCSSHGYLPTVKALNLDGVLVECIQCGGRDYAPFWSKDPIEKSLQVFYKYQTEYGNHFEAKDFDFWLACLKNQIAEAELHAKEGDWHHVRKELIDLISVSLDTISKSHEFGISQIPFKRRLYYIRNWIHERLDQNGQKNLTGRDKKFYEEKTAQIEKELGRVAYH